MSPFAKTYVLDFPVYDTNRRKADLAKDNSKSDAQILHIFYELSLFLRLRMSAALKISSGLANKLGFKKGFRLARQTLFFLSFHGDEAQVNYANTMQSFSKYGVEKRL
ncbi:MAG: hypothetical protein ACPG6H_07480 [Paracoccaceae bacterium]